MQLGVIGLGTMGASLARNAARNGAEVVLFNRTKERTDALIKEHDNEGKFVPCKTLKEFVKKLEPPRAILLMVNAGKSVNEVIEALTPLLQKKDILIDAGNSHYLDTERRAADLQKKGIRFLGMGVSGGEEGALRGPSMMPGGDESAYKELEPLFAKMSAKDGEGDACVTYIGPGGSGHFVKMVHNGIEYADMQLIAEAYHLLTYLHPGLSNEELAETFEEWNQGEDLKSFLIEITAKIFRKKDELSEEYLIDIISDAAEQKGTGKWMTQVALDLNVPVPTITAAVDARLLSSLKEERIEASKNMKGIKVETPTISADEVKSALIVSRICVYAQGFALMKRASDEYGWKTDLSEIGRIWQGGCIIRSALLPKISDAWKKNQELKNLVVAPSFMRKFREEYGTWTQVVSKGILAGVPLPAMSASLMYFESCAWDRLPQNLTQAQRDYFGAHGYERIDREGTFHTDWTT